MSVRGRVVARGVAVATVGMLAMSMLAPAARAEVTVTVVDGVATFPALSVNLVGTGYELHATSGTLTSATSTAFNIAPAAPSVLRFIVQPTSAPAATTIAPAVRVEARDAFGNVATGYNGNVTIAIGTNPGAGTLLGATTTAAVSGIALARSTEAEKQSQLARLRTFHERHREASGPALERLQQVALANGNVFEALMDAVRVCSLGQITHALFEVGGQYRRNM